MVQMRMPAKPSGMSRNSSGTTSALAAHAVSETSLYADAMIGNAPSCAKSDRPKPSIAHPADLDSQGGLIWDRRGCQNPFQTGIVTASVAMVKNES